MPKSIFNRQGNRMKDRRCGLLWPAKFPPLRGGGLEPAFRVLFSAIFHEFRLGISIRVEICGKEWNQNCSFFVVKLLTKFSCVFVFWQLSAFSRESEESQCKAVSSSGNCLIADSRPPPLGGPNTGRAPSPVNSRA